MSIAPKPRRELADEVPGRVWYWLLATVLLALLRFTPSTRLQLPTPSQAGQVDGHVFAVSRVQALQVQRFDPWFFLNGRSRETSRWRLLIPALAKWTHLPVSAYFLLPRIGGALLVFAAAWLTWHGTRQVIATIGIAALTATTAPFAVAMDWIQFDPYLLLALLGFAYVRTGTLTWAAAALGPWLDERFILILPALVGLRWAQGKPALAAAVWGVLPYGLVRLAALAFGDSSLGDQVELQHLYNAWWPAGWWYGFRVAWIPIVIGLVAAGRAIQRQTGSLALALWMASLLAGLGAIVWLAYDTSRSIAVLLPFLIHGGIALHRTARAAPILVSSVVLNFALPNAHVVGGTYYPITPIWRPPVEQGLYYDPTHPIP